MAGASAIHEELAKEKTESMANRKADITADIISSVATQISSLTWSTR